MMPSGLFHVGKESVEKEKKRTMREGNLHTAQIFKDIKYLLSGNDML